MYKKLLILLFATVIFANEQLCDFNNTTHVQICKQSLKKGVPFEYVCGFLTSAKSMELDEVSFKYLQPSYIKKFSENEKKANKKLSDEFIPKMVEHLKEHGTVYDYVETKYGVNREVVAAILMKETKLGNIKFYHDAFLVFNTISMKITDPQTDREKWLLGMARSNTTSIISHCFKLGLAPDMCDMPSSYAGAVGISQFMPESFNYSQGYANPYADLNHMPDAIMSTSKFLHDKGSFTKLLNWDNIPDIVSLESRWYEAEFLDENASLLYEFNKKTDKEYSCFTCDDIELDYFRAYAKKIMRYNNSSNYAMGVLRLAYDAQKRLKEESEVCDSEALKAFEDEQNAPH